MDTYWGCKCQGCGDPANHISNEICKQCHDNFTKQFPIKDVVAYIFGNATITDDLHIMMLLGPNIIRGNKYAALLAAVELRILRFKFEGSVKQHLQTRVWRSYSHWYFNGIPVDMASIVDKLYRDEGLQPLHITEQHIYSGLRK